MAYETGYRSTAAERRAKAAAAAAELAAERARLAALTPEQYLDDARTTYGREHNSNPDTAEGRAELLAFHADLVAEVLGA